MGPSLVESLVLDKTKTKITSHPFLQVLIQIKSKENISLGAMALDRDGTNGLGYISEEKFIYNETK